MSQEGARTPGSGNALGRPELRPDQERGSYGWRARIGFITAGSTIETPVYELYRMAPEGIALVSMSLGIRHVTAEAVDAAWEAAAAAAREVAQYNVDCLIVSGSPLAYLRGRGADRELIEYVQSACGIPTTFELTASIDGLRSLGARRLAVAAPFSQRINQRLQSFLEAEGFEVRAIAGLDKDSNPEITMLPIHASYKVAHQVYRQAPDVDAIYITCPRWPVSPNVELLEQELRIPVVASVQSGLWAALRSLNLRAPVPGYGRLLREL